MATVPKILYHVKETFEICPSNVPLFFLVIKSWDLFALLSLYFVTQECILFIVIHKSKHKDKIKLQKQGLATFKCGCKGRLGAI